MFNEDVIASNMFVFFLGGAETTASTLTWCIYELALNPQIQDTLREEIINESNKHGGIIPPDHLHKLEYLEMVICGRRIG